MIFLIFSEIAAVNSKTPFAMSPDCLGRSENLVKLVQRLRHENQSHNFDSIIDSRTHESTTESVPLEGIKSSRAAVLICLFEDEKDELRVILTRRSSTLSSHSGKMLALS